MNSYSTLYSNMSSLNIEDSINDDDIIITMRVDAVIELIKQFVTDNKLIPHSTNNIFKLIYMNCSSSMSEIQPSQLLFDKKLVNDILRSIDISSIPKINL